MIKANYFAIVCDKLLVCTYPGLICNGKNFEIRVSRKIHVIKKLKVNVPTAFFKHGTLKHPVSQSMRDGPQGENSARKFPKKHHRWM